MTTATPSTALATIQPAFTDPERLALAGFLAGFRGLTREAYALDLRQFTSWCRARSLVVFAVRRADIESFARELEARGRARATVTRRLCTIAGFYKYAVEEELLEHSPAAHVRRRRVEGRAGASALRPGLALAMAVLATRARSVIERVAGATYGADGVRFRAAHQRLAQAANVHINGATVDEHVTSPNAIKQLLARQHAAAILHKERQQTKFRRAQSHVAGPAHHPMGGAVEHDVTRTQRVGDALGCGTPKQCFHAGDHFRDGKRLDDVVIRADGEPAHTIAFFAARGKHQDGNGGGGLATPQPAAQLDAR